MLRSLPARALDTIATPTRFWCVLGLAITLQFAFRLVMMPAASQDDAEQLIVAQTLAAGYTPSQPPLYTWMVIASQALFGVSVFAVVAVKFLCQAALFAFTYLAARRALLDHQLAAMASASLFAVYYVGWDTVYNYSHTPLWTAATAATLYALLCVRDGRSWAAYAGLGLAISVGLLSKYGYAVFLCGLGVACLCERSFRTTLADRRVAVTFGIIVLALAPHAAWLASGAVDVSATAESRLTVGTNWDYWQGVGNALAKLVNALISFYFPLWLLLAIAFPSVWWRRLPESSPVSRLLGLSLLGSLTLVLIAILVFGMTTFRTHYAVLFLPWPLLFFVRAQAMGVGERALGRYALAVAAATVAFVVGVPIKAVVEPQTCSNCYYNMPYARIAAEIREGGFQRGTIVAHFHRIQIGGNLKAEFPDSRVISTKYPFAVPEASKERGACLLIWDARASAVPPPELLRFARETVDARLPETLTVQSAEARMAWAHERTVSLAYVLIEDGC